LFTPFAVLVQGRDVTNNSATPCSGATRMTRMTPQWRFHPWSMTAPVTARKTKGPLALWASKVSS
jgi:hypothetical protein